MTGPRVLVRETSQEGPKALLDPGYSCVPQPLEYIFFTLPASAKLDIYEDLESKESD